LQLRARNTALLMMDKRNLSKSPCQKSKIDKETVIKVTDIQSINLVSGGNDNEFGGGGGIPRLHLLSLFLRVMVLMMPV